MATTATLTDDIAADKQEWIDSLDYIYRTFGEAGVIEILRSLQNHTLAHGIALNEATRNTPYVNTIPPHEQPRYPGDIELETGIEQIIRWNAMAMVLQAQDKGTNLGGHIATYASAATFMEVGFNHFFRQADENYGGDLIFFQPHASPGIYARSWLEGLLSEEQLTNFRRELQPGGGLSSYPHPRSMPDYWQVPSASMGLSTPTAIYQARFARYLENRGLKPRNGGRVWCFIGDGESDEPEVLGSINIAAREKLDNLILVVNCNLQRLDGPVRGNGKIIQELERCFRGADWNVIKVIWGSGWDGLLARDHDGALRNRMEECLDGDYQMFSVSPGNLQREHWVEGHPELEAMMNSLTDDEIRRIKRGGQDHKKIYAAFHRAVRCKDRPTVILMKTVKGDGMGPGAQGSNTAHQKKNLTADERLQCARDYNIPLSDDAVMRAEFYRPADDSREITYLKQRRAALGGSLPQRRVVCQPIEPPDPERFSRFLRGSDGRTVSTTSEVIRLLRSLLRDGQIGHYIVPIVPDEARTFGMDVLFKAAGIYAPEGQHYTPVDADSLLPYREARDGQILQEGICEVGAMASFQAAGTAYAVHGLPMIPFYIFYSMFGFQRVGDMIWSCGDVFCRGFLLGGTAGRTTLNGEGLQHQDGHSHIIASTIPNLISYDPAFAGELAIIVREGIRRMYQQQEDLMYYITVYNEACPMPAIPDDPAVHDGIIKGGYCFRQSATQRGEQIHLLASGSVMQQALQAADLLEDMGYRVDIWSITSFVELERNIQTCERWNRLHPSEPPKQTHVESMFADIEPGVCSFVAVTDYMKRLAGGITRYVPGRFQVLGTDGYGLSESRSQLRDYFEISPAWIAQAAIAGLYAESRIPRSTMQQQLDSLGLDPDTADPVCR